MIENYCSSEANVNMSHQCLDRVSFGISSVLTTKPVHAVFTYQTYMYTHTCYMGVYYTTSQHDTVIQYNKVHLFNKNSNKYIYLYMYEQHKTHTPNIIMILFKNNNILPLLRVIHKNSFIIEN